jgi:flagellar L-ring protein FlgH
MRTSSFSAVLAFGLAASIHIPDAWAKRQPVVDGPEPTPIYNSPTAPGAIFSLGNYVPLTSGSRAAREGDVITIVLLERTSASNSSSAATERGGSFGLTPPSTGPFSLFKTSDVSASGNQSFKGKGEIAQSNLLTGEVSVTVTAVYPNGTLLVRGEKQLTLNRGIERIQISGLVRNSDISPDNRVASTRVANAKIAYTGKGEIARASRQGWLQRFFSKISPF